MAESLDFKCNDCDQVFKTERGLNIHIGSLHKDLILSTPEKERINSNVAETTLTSKKERRQKRKKHEKKIMQPLAFF